jgi:tetratricopeptide (TPR) repeat protein
METTERIDRYLNGELSAAERKKIEEELRQNIDLQREIATNKMIKDAVKTAALRAQVKQIHNEFMRDYVRDTPATPAEEARVVPLRPSKGAFWWVSRVAAAGLLLVVSIGTYQMSSVNGSDLYNEKYLSYKLPTVRSENTKDSTLDSLYSAGNFATVIAQTDAKKIKQPQDHFLLAMSHLNQKQFGEAVADFEVLRKVNAERGVKYFEAEAEYYEALALIGNQKYDQALEIFEKIHNDGTHLFHANISQWDLWQLRILDWKN